MIGICDLNAGAGGPSRPTFLLERSAQCVAFDVAVGAAGRAIEQDVVGGISDAPARSRKPGVLGFTRRRRTRRAARAVEPRTVEIAFDTEHEGTALKVDPERWTDKGAKYAKVAAV